MRNQAVQKVGEDAAAALLQADGWRLLHRNWRLKMGELDLVAVKGGVLAFIEVKARRAPSFVDPALGSTGASSASSGGWPTPTSPSSSRGL